MIFSIKDKLIGLLALIIIIGVFGFIFGYKQYSKVRTERDDAVENVSVLQKGNTTSVTKSGDTVKTNGVIQQTINDLMKNDTVKSKIIKDLNLRIKNITSITDGNAKGDWDLSAKSTTDTIHDTIHHIKIVYKETLFEDSCISQTVKQYKDSATSKTHIIIPIFAAMDLRYVDKWKIKNIIYWRTKFPFISAYSTCKNVTINLHQTDIKK